MNNFNDISEVNIEEINIESNIVSLQEKIHGA